MKGNSLHGKDKDHPWRNVICASLLKNLLLFALKGKRLPEKSPKNDFLNKETA
jgi:hypothetical protein